ncbi:MAG: hypothetical protein ABFC94_15115 [Syntrophomonas sp.]
MESSEFQVGQLFKPYADKPLPLQENSKLAMNASGHLLLIICLNNISEKELQQLSTLPIAVRILDDSAGHLLPFFRLGKTDFIFETPFDPCVYNEDRIFLMPSDEKLAMVVIEANTNDIVASRSINLPRSLSRKLLINWTAAFEKPEYFSATYARWVESLQSILRIKILWRFAGEQVELTD